MNIVGAVSIACLVMTTVVGVVSPLGSIAAGAFSVVAIVVTFCLAIRRINRTDRADLAAARSWRP